MLEEALSRLIEGILSGIGIGFIFYLYPVVRHTFSDGYTYGFIMGTIIGPFGSQNGI